MDFEGISMPQYAIIPEQSVAICRFYVLNYIFKFDQSSPNKYIINVILPKVDSLSSAVTK